MADNEQNVQQSMITITVSENKERAFITLMAPQDGNPPSVAQLMDALKAEGVVHGINQDMLGLLAKGQRYRTQELVATGTPPVDGSPAHFEYLFPISSEAKPKELANGSVDFKNLGIIKNVVKGEPVCIKTPATPGTPGMDVKGVSIPCRPGKDYPLPAGQHTKVSEDGLSLIAKVDGQVDLIHNRVVVMSVFKIEGNVDYNTGNIDFVGNVDITGDVIAGFTVKAGGNVQISGCVDGGVVEAEGNITVINGINGGSSGRIVCGGNLRCKHLHSAKVTVENDMETTSCVNSTVQVGGRALFMGKKAMILSSRVSAGRYIEVLNVGSPSSSAGNIIEVGTNPHISERARQIPVEMRNIENNVESLNKLITLYNQLNKQNRLDDAKKAELTKLTATIEKSKLELQILEQEKEDVDHNLRHAGHGMIKVLGTAFAGTQIIIGKDQIKLTSDYQFTQFTKAQGGIKSAPTTR